MNLNNTTRLAKIACLAACLAGIATVRANFVYNDFSNVSALTLNGDAAQANNGSQDVLRVTPSTTGQAGSAFTTSTISLAADASFSTAFSFQFSAPGPNPIHDGADGMVFVVQTVANNVGSAGGGIGYQGIANSVGVEFDTFNNGSGLGDLDANHVAINKNGALSPTLAYANLNGLGQLDQGGIWYAWVDYNGVTDELAVRVSTSPVRPLASTISATVDLPAVLGSVNAYVGFTSGTGIAYNNHDVLTWEFRQEFDPVGVPEGGFILPMACAAWVGAAWARRRINRA